MTINVTQEHIQQGKRFDRRHCPVAVAIRDVTDRDVMIYMGWIHFQLSIGWHSHQTHPDMVEIIYHYDVTGEMKPFAFDLEIEK